MGDGLSQLVFVRDGWACRHCRNRSSLHPHHVIFRSAGGMDELNNLITLCAVCHSAVHEDRLLIEVISKTDNDIKVYFTRLNNWKPL